MEKNTAKPKKIVRAKAKPKTYRRLKTVTKTYEARTRKVIYKPTKEVFREVDGELYYKPSDDICNAIVAFQDKLVGQGRSMRITYTIEEITPAPKPVKK